MLDPLPYLEVANMYSGPWLETMYMYMDIVSGGTGHWCIITLICFGRKEKKSVNMPIHVTVYQYF